MWDQRTSGSELRRVFLAKWYLERLSDELAIVHTEKRPPNRHRCIVKGRTNRIVWSVV